ncbi:type IV secretion system DNA-binding domain-containing protein [Candidatus Sumerlaeota bacterium]|nr:type IV secretion system DNA-binding domain-containing protein [Candidatus Sumerlaeota bacterium]
MIDDGRQASWLTRLLDHLGGVQSFREPDDGDEIPVSDVPSPVYDTDDDIATEWQVLLPDGANISLPVVEQLLLGLSFCSAPLAFEIIGNEKQIAMQLACRRSDESRLLQQAKAHAPGAVWSPPPQPLPVTWPPPYERPSLVVDFGLSNAFLLPLRIWSDLKTDPLVGVVGALSNLMEEEWGALQILFSPIHQPWAASALHALNFFDAPELLSQARQKISAPLFAVCLRVAVSSPDENRCWRIAQDIAAPLEQLSNPTGNELIPLDNDGYDAHDHLLDFLERRSRRSGMLLNVRELLSLLHFPSESVKSAKLLRLDRRSKAVPEIALDHALTLGVNQHNGQERTVTLSADQRTRHVYVVGASGTGKSTLLLNMIRQDIEGGEGLAVLDPHGDLIDRILEFIPEERFDDVVLFDPSDGEFPVGFNILEAHTELEKTLLASDLVAVFRRLSTAWGDQMNSVLANTIVAFLESSEGGTLSDLRRFLVEPAFRKKFLETVSDKEIVYYWQTEFPMLSGKPQGPLLTRLDTFLRPKLIRHIVCQQKTKLDFARVMNGRGIFLAKLAQGAIGEENAHLLGALLVAKIHQTALSRQDIAEAQRQNFWLYIDEFHHFITPSMSSILSGVRKFRMGLILAHQELRQLGQDSEVVNSVLSNPYTRICFRLGDADARKLAAGFSAFEEKDLLNLSTGQAIVRMERAEYDFNLTVPMLEPIEPELAEERTNAIRELSRDHYATEREEVEAALNHRWEEYAAEEEEKKRKAEEEKQAKKKTADASKTFKTVQESPAGSSTTSVETALKETVALTSQLPSSSAPATAATPEAKPPTPPAALRKTAPPAPALGGRGGQQHKYLQNLITQLAQGMGWRADLEKPVLDGAGSVDVALEKTGCMVACEISVTTPVEHEVGNIEKCLKADFDHILAVSNEPKHLNKIKQAAAAALPEAELAKVAYCAPEEVIACLEQIDARLASKEQTVRGWKVKVNYQPQTEQEKAAKKEAISQVLLKRLAGKMKKKR